MTTEELEALRRRLVATYLPGVTAVPTPVAAPTPETPVPVEVIPVEDVVAVDYTPEVMAAWTAAWTPAGAAYCTADHLDHLSSSVRPVPRAISLSQMLTVLKQYKIPATAVLSTTVGPQVTTYVVSLEDGARVSTLKAKEVDTSFGLGVKGIRMLPYVEGRPGCIGLEVPNAEAGTVSYRDVLTAVLPSLEASKNKYIGVALGLETNGRPHMVPLGNSENPHLLIAGKSGSGKSIAIWNVLASVAAVYTPDEVAVYIVDPKRMGYSKWKAMPHLMTPVMTDTPEVVAMLSALASKDGPTASELDRRTRLLGEYLVDDLAEYNALVTPRQALPRILVVIDEYADLMACTTRTRSSGASPAQTITALIDRIALLGRAAGIHLVLATQRPTADTMLPSIKAQTTKIACTVKEAGDSRIILGESCTEGADKLLGAGDSYVQGREGLTRVKCAYIQAGDISALLQEHVLSQALAIANQQP